MDRQALGTGLVATGGLTVALSVCWWLDSPNALGLQRGVLTMWIGSAIMMLGLIALTTELSHARWSGQGRGWSLLALAIGLRLAVAWWPPWLSDDVYRYLWDGMLLAEGIDPFAFVPSDPALAFAHGTDLFTRLNSADFYSVYPPLTQLAFGSTGWLTERHGWVAGYAGWKVLALLVETVGLVYAFRVLRPYAFAWIGLHPLCMIELSGQGHTEFLMWPLLLVALKGKRTTAKWTGLTGAILAKLTPVLLIPEAMRRSPRERLGAIVTLGGLGALAFVAFGGIDSVRHAVESLRLYTRYFEFNAGPYYAVKGGFQALTGSDWSKQVGPAFGMLSLTAVAIIWVRAFHRPDAWPFAKVAYAVFATLIVCATTVHPWYLVPILVCLSAVYDQSDRQRLPLGFGAWQWLALISLATYARYFDGPYTLVVTMGWIGWLCWLLRDVAVAERSTTSIAL